MLWTLFGLALIAAALAVLWSLPFLARTFGPYLLGAVAVIGAASVVVDLL